MRSKTRNVSFTVLCLAAAEALLLAYAVHMKFEPAWMAVIAIMSLAALVIHIRACLKEPDYLRRLLGLKRHAGKRIPQLDHLRVFAVCGVILTHIIQTDIESYKAPVLYAANIAWVLTMAANAIYVMLSGALLYRWKEEKLRIFYFRRFITVVVPLALYYRWYTAVNYHLGRGWDWVSLKSVPHWLLANEMREAPHFWLIYVILSIYVTVPLFRHLFRHVCYRDLTKALAAIFLFCAFSNALLPYAILAVALPVSVWLFISFLGYWVSLEETRKFDRVLMTAGLAAAAVIGVLTLIDPDKAFLNQYCLNDRPLVMLVGLGLFAFVFGTGRFFAKDNVLVSCISRYGYGIILIHWWTLHFVVRARFSISSMSFHYFGTVVSLVLTLIISWVFCFAADNFLVMPIQRLLSKILRVNGQ